MKIAGKTDIGFSRVDNQDAYCGGKIGENLLWATVCDGMGGTYGGAIASGLAIEVIEESFTTFLSKKPTNEEIEVLMRQTVKNANELIYNKAQEEEITHGMGTTLVAMVINADIAHVIYAGDSRAYSLSGRDFIRLTKDHSVVQELVESGTITEMEAKTHPRKNIITKVLGVENTIEADYFSIKTTEGDLFLLCTDGLTSVINDKELYELLQNNDTDFFEIANILVSAALEKQSQDNITAVVLQTNFTSEGV
jgi:Serine/threonine protein phosphatase